MQFDLTPPQRAFQAKARELARGPIAARAAEIDRTEQYPEDNIALLKVAAILAWCGTRACSQSAAARRRTCAPSLLRGCSGCDCRRLATGI